MPSNPSSTTEKRLARQVEKPSIETPSITFTSGNCCSFTQFSVFHQGVLVLPPCKNVFRRWDEDLQPVAYMR